MPTPTPRRPPIPWQRFWRPADEPGLGVDELGYLLDPEGHFGHLANPLVSSLDSLLPYGSGVLVLKGEQGIGKSWELDKAWQKLTSRRADIPQEATRVVFREVPSFAEFDRRTFDSSKWGQWRGSSDLFTLVVDGVDEGLLQLPSFLNYLLGRLRDEPVDRLRLILACRSQLWQTEPGATLLSLWPQRDAPSEVELCPLRRADVALAATTHGYDQAAFLAAVEERRVHVFAARPVTLLFLLDEYRAGAKLSGTHRDLYEKGTRNLIREVDRGRLQVMRASDVASEHIQEDAKWRAAQNLAVLLMIGGRAAVRAPQAAFIEVEAPDLPLETATKQGSLTLEFTALQEVVSSALFVSSGPDRFSFAHQSFAECLAAQALQGLSVVQLKSFLCQRDFTGEHVIPQLSDLAIWLTLYHEDFCRYLLQIEPDALLRSDLTHFSEDLKVRLIDQLLQGARDNKIHDGIGFADPFPALNHPGLAEQLRPVITNHSEHLVARRIALALARECRCSALSPDLFRIVQENSESDQIRDQAARALAKAVPDDDIHLLEPLARGHVQPDPDDAIKGYALQRLVPSHWSVVVTLPYLTPEKDTSCLGTYNTFLRRGLAEALQDEDLPQALKWLRNDPRRLHPRSSFASFAIEIILKSLHLLDQSQIQDEFIHTWQILARSRQLIALTRASKVQQWLAEHRNTSHNLATLFLNDANTTLEDLSVKVLRLLCHDVTDLDWLLDQITTVAAPAFDRWTHALAELASLPLFYQACLDKIRLRISQMPLLKERWAHLVDGQQGQSFEHYFQTLSQELGEENESVVAYDPAVTIKEAFRHFHAGGLGSWTSLWRALINNVAGDPLYAVEWDLTSCPNWTLLTEEEKAGMPRMARAFLLTASCGETQPDQISAVQLSARRALWLLRDSIAADQPLIEQIFSTWLPLLMRNNEQYKDPSCQLFKIIYELRPNETRQTLLRSAREMIRNGYADTLDVAKEVWDATLTRSAIELIEESTQLAYIRFALLALEAKDKDGTLVYLKSVLQVTSDNQYSIQYLAAAEIAVASGREELWSLIHAFILSNEDQAKCVIEKVCGTIGLDGKAYLAGHSEPILGDLCRLLYRHFPPSSDAEHMANQNVTAEECARRIRMQMPSIIAAKGTLQACEELQRLASEIPEDRIQIYWCLRQAQQSFRRTNWQPLSFEVIKTLLHQSKTRLIGSEGDLLDVVIESLQRLQRSLGNQMLPTAEHLWSWDGAGNKRKNFRPKDEEAFSDYIAQWLIADIGASAGVVVNREVQPRRHARLDVIIDAVTSGPDSAFTKLTVIVEAKGCWHADVLTGLDSQLVRGYMEPHGLRYGVYLVGWFICPQWLTPINHLQSNSFVDASNEVKQLAESYDRVTSGYTIQSLLLNCALPPEKAPSAKPKSAKTTRPNATKSKSTPKQRKSNDPSGE